MHKLVGSLFWVTISTISLSQSPSCSALVHHVSPSAGSYQKLLKRRTIVTAGGFAIVASTPIGAQAAPPMDAGEAIRRSAASIPGFGPTDVFFPEELLGTWRMTREVEIPGRQQPIRFSYPFRFIQSIDDKAVVADRGYNQAELEKALTQAVIGTESSSVRSYDWAKTNPNDLRLAFADGSKKEIKVTKRATEKTDATVTSSEFQRITQEDERGIPVVSARRVLTKWKRTDDSTLEGLEVVYSMAGGDPMAGSSSSGQPSILTKSRLHLERQR
eukprot:scaffold4009_cov124-Cylindrotheca_fusiformis.AAC.12